MHDASISIFLSHSSKDNDLCIRLAQDLRRLLGDETAVWYDTGSLHGGEAWWRKIVKELTARPVFILLLSPDSMNSSWVNDEIDLAWRQKNSPTGKQIIPILVRDCKVREELLLLQIISFVSPKKYKEAFNELLTALGLAQTGIRPTEPTVPPSQAPRPWELLKQSVFRTRVILLIGLILLFLLASGIGLLSFVQANQAFTNNAHAIATTRATTATAAASTYASATAFAQNLSTSATANANATATVLSTAIAANPEPYSSSGILALYDPLSDNSMGNSWNESTNKYGGACVFTGGAYHVGQANTTTTNYCTAASTDFSNFAFEVQMKIIKGNAGGIIFRADPTRYWAFYEFVVGQDGSYQFILCDTTCNPPLRNSSSSAIKQGLNQTNLVAVKAQGSRIALYINHQLIDSVADGTYSHGQIGLIAYPYYSSSFGKPTEVIYSNAKVWTL